MFLTGCALKDFHNVVCANKRTEIKKNNLKNQFENKSTYRDNS